MSHFSYESYLFGVGRDGFVIKSVPAALIDENLCVEAVCNAPMSIRHIDDRFQTERVCIEAVSRDGLSLQYVTKQNNTICAAALAQNKFASQYVHKYTRELKKLLNPDYFIQNTSSEYLLEMVKEEGTNIRFIADEYITKELVMAAVRDDGMAIHYIDEDWQTPDVCYTAVTQCGLAIKYIGEERRTQLVKNAAVLQCGNSLGLVDAAERTPTMYKNALYSHDHLDMNLYDMRDDPAIHLRAVPVADLQQYVNSSKAAVDATIVYGDLSPASDTSFVDGIIDEEDQLDIIGKYSDCITALPVTTRGRTHVNDCVRAASRIKPESAVVLNHNILTEEDYIAIVSTDGELYRCIWVPHQTYKIALAAVKNNGIALRDVMRSGHRDHDIYMAAVSSYGEALQWIPQEDRTPAMIIAAVQNEGFALQYVADEDRTKTVLMCAVKQNGNAIMHTVDRDLDVCLAAIHQEPRAARHILKHNDFHAGNVTDKVIEAVRAAHVDVELCNLLRARVNADDVLFSILSFVYGVRLV